MHHAPHAPSADNLTVFFHDLSLFPVYLLLSFPSLACSLISLSPSLTPSLALSSFLSLVSTLMPDDMLDGVKNRLSWGCWQAIDAIVSFFFSLAFHYQAKVSIWGFVMQCTCGASQGCFLSVSFRSCCVFFLASASNTILFLYAPYTLWVLVLSVFSCISYLLFHNTLHILDNKTWSASTVLMKTLI